MAGNGLAASAFVDSFLRGWNFIDDMKRSQREERRQTQLDAEQKHYRDERLALDRQQIEQAGAGTWSAPQEALDASSGKPGLYSVNSRSGEVRGLPGVSPPTADPKHGTTTYRDGGYEVTRATVNGMPVGAPIGRSAIRQESPEAFNNPVDEIDVAGNPVRAQYGSRGSRRVVEGVKPASGATAKPMSSAAQKAEDADLDALSLASNMQADLQGFLSQIQKGDLQLGPVRNLVSQARNFTGQSTPASANYASFRAALEKLRNDSLRLNKGVQTEGDSTRAWNELVANLNDPAVVSQRLQEIANLNARARQYYEKRIQSRRRVWGSEPLDTREFEAEGAAYVGGQSEHGPAVVGTPGVSNDSDYSHLWR